MTPEDWKRACHNRAKGDKQVKLSAIEMLSDKCSLRMGIIKPTLNLVLRADPLN